MVSKRLGAKPWRRLCNNNRCYGGCCFFKQHGPFEFTEKRPIVAVAKDTPKLTPPTPIVKDAVPDYSEALVQAKEEIAMYLANKIKDGAEGGRLGELIIDLETIYDIGETKYWKSYNIVIYGHVVTPKEKNDILRRVLGEPGIKEKWFALERYMLDSPPETQELGLKHTIPVDLKTGKPTGPGIITDPLVKEISSLEKIRGDQSQKSR